MPHVFLQCLDIISGPQTVHGKRVPQIVYAMMLQSGFLQQLLKLLPDGGLGQMRTIIQYCMETLLAGFFKT